MIFEPLLSCFITQFEQSKLLFCSFSKVGPLELFFFKESYPVFGWQRREGIPKYKCLCFPSKLLSHCTYSEELFDLKKDRLDEFTFLTNLGVCIACSKRADCVFGWREKIRDCLYFPSNLLNHNTYSGRLFNLKNGRLDEFSMLRNLRVSNRAA